MCARRGYTQPRATSGPHSRGERSVVESIGNLVYNDAVPGERQFRNVNEERIQAFAAKHNLPLEEGRMQWEARHEALRTVYTRPKVKAKLADRIPLGSHDDTTVEHVDEAYEAGATLSEMPCTIEAARRAKGLGMMVCMGAPNYFRGGSHCGNLSCVDAMAEGLVDILCSDFHFPSMLASAVRMIRAGMDPADAINMISLNPARHLRRDRDLGSVEEGKKADLVAFSPRDSFAAVTHVWVDGIVRLKAGADSRAHDACANLASAR